MLSYYLRKSDTANMVAPYLRKSDTTTMLVPYLRKSDTANMVAPYLRKSDTASMLSPYFRLPSFNNGSVIFSDGTTLKQDNYGLFFDSSNNRLAINFLGVTPLYNLSLSGSFGITSGTSGYMDNADYIGLNYTTTGGSNRYPFNQSGNAVIQSRTSISRDVLIATASTGNSGYATPKFIVKGDGNVLIGDSTDNGLHKLQVSGKGKFTDSLIGNTISKIGGTGTNILLDNGSTIPISSYGTGTVTSVATNNGSGITGGTFTTTGTIAADTTVLSTKANVTASLLGKLNISDTASMLSNRLKISDTATMLSKLTLDRVLGNGSVSGRSFTSGVPTFWGVTSGTATSDSILMISSAVTKKVSANSYIWNSTSGQSAVFNNTNPTTTFSNSASLYGGISTASITSGGGSQSAQYGNVGLWGQIGLGNTTSITANANSFFSGLHGDAYKRDAGNLVGTISAVSGRLLMNGSATTDNGYSFRAMTPIQEPAGSWSGTLTSGGGLYIDAIRGTTNITSGGRFITARSIYSAGTTDTAEFAGYLKVGNTIQGTLSTAAQTNITSVGSLSGLTITGTFNGTHGTFIGTLIQQNITNGINLIGLNSSNGTRRGNLYVTDTYCELQTPSTIPLYLSTNGTARITLDGSTGAALFSSLGTGTVYSNSGTLTNTNPSDSSLKDSIKVLTYGLKEVLQLKPKTFYYRSDSAKTSLKYGFIAQDVQKIMPDMVRKLNPQDEKSKLGLEIDGIYVTLINAIKEQQAQIEELKARILKLENK
jgi:hypothetical protein